MNNKPHTEEAKAKMRLSHAEVSKRPEVINKRSQGGYTSWQPERREEQRQAIKDGIKWKMEREREEQEQRNAINRAKVKAYLEGLNK